MFAANCWPNDGVRRGALAACCTRLLRHASDSAGWVRSVILGMATTATSKRQTRETRGSAKPPQSKSMKRIRMGLTIAGYFGKRCGMPESIRIRNFSIIAHIDHGKSTLADRLMEATGTVSARDMKAQLLDSMDIERERGITIKANTVRIEYMADDGNPYVLNLIDTPGHVDFAYEVSRSMRAVEGSLLVVDASQGVEAQTLANAYQAVAADHDLVPVLNKIDLPASDPETVRGQIEEVVGIDASQAIEVSAKTGIGIGDVLEAIVGDLPAPEGELDAPLKALLVDSWYNQFLGVVVLVRIFDGVLRKGDQVRLMSTGQLSRRPGGRIPSCDGRGSGTRSRRDRILHGVDQAGAGHSRRRHGHARKKRMRGADRRHAAFQTRRVLRLVSGGQQRFRESAGSDRQNIAERRVVQQRAGNLRRFGIRVSMRISGAAALGSHPRPAGARIRAGLDNHRRRRSSTRSRCATAAKSASTIRRTCPIRRKSTRSWSRGSMRRYWFLPSIWAKC